MDRSQLYPGECSENFSDNESDDYPITMEYPALDLICEKLKKFMDTYVEIKKPIVYEDDYVKELWDMDFNYYYMSHDPYDLEADNYEWSIAGHSSRRGLSWL